MSFMDDAQAQTQEELARIVAVLTELTGLTSRWSGHVELVPDADFKGKKLFRCDILIDAALARQPERWSTLIHEALHSLSAGYNQDDFHRFRGWEEGVVEQLQRLYRPEVFKRLSVKVEESVFSTEDAKHAYNRFIRALENLRVAVEVPDERQVDFYRNLLAVPLLERAARIRSLGPARSSDEWAGFVSVFSLANSVLKG